MDIQTYDMVGKLINPIVENLEDALSDQGYQAELDQALAVTRQQLQWQPEALRRAEDLARETIEEKRARKAGQLAYTLQMVAGHVEQHLQPRLQEAMTAPSSAVAWYRATGKIATDDQQLAMSTLHEQRWGRFESEADISPAAARARYEAALRTPFEQLSASVIAWTETKHGSGWTGRTLTPDEALAGEARKLAAAIAATKKGRLTQGATEAIGVKAKAQALAEGATRIRIGRHRVTKEVTRAWKDLVA